MELLTFNSWASKLFLVLLLMQLSYSCAVLLLYIRLKRPRKGNYKVEGYEGFCHF